MADELTEALKELRTVLPLGAVEIRCSVTEKGTTHVVIMSAYLPTVPYAPTLSEAMAQVRSWKAAQDAAGER